MTERCSILLHHPAKSKQNGRSSFSVSLPGGRRVLRFTSKGVVLDNFRSKFLPHTYSSTSSFFPPFFNIIPSLLIIYPSPFFFYQLFSGLRPWLKRQSSQMVCLLVFRGRQLNKLKLLNFSFSLLRVKTLAFNF